VLTVDELANKIRAQNQPDSNNQTATKMAKNHRPNQPNRFYAF
jgi:hypothetical protein